MGDTKIKLINVDEDEWRPIETCYIGDYFESRNGDYKGFVVSDVPYKKDGIEYIKVLEIVKGGFHSNGIIPDVHVRVAKSVELGVQF